MISLLNKALQRPTKANLPWVLWYPTRGLKQNMLCASLVPPASRTMVKQEVSVLTY